MKLLIMRHENVIHAGGNKWYVPLLTVLLLALSIRVNGDDDGSIGNLRGVNIDVNGYRALSVTREAIEGVSDTEFGSGLAINASLLYKISRSVQLGAGMSYASMPLLKSGDDLGTLDLFAILFLFEWWMLEESTSQDYTLPTYGRSSCWMLSDILVGKLLDLLVKIGVYPYLSLGLGVNTGSFEKGSYLTDLELSDGTTYDITTEMSFAIKLGVGFHYLIMRHVSIGIESSFLMSNLGTTWKSSKPDVAIDVDSMEQFFTSTIQLVGGLRIWL